MPQTRQCNIGRIVNRIATQQLKVEALTGRARAQWVRALFHENWELSTQHHTIAIATIG